MVYWCFLSAYASAQRRRMHNQPGSLTQGRATGTLLLVGYPLRCRRMGRPYSMGRIQRPSRSRRYTPRSAPSSSTPWRQRIPLIFSSQTLAFNGAGIVDHSSNSPTFSITNGALAFVSVGVDTAGDATIITNSAGVTFFTGASTGGQARFTTNSGGSSIFLSCLQAG
jgi:hypothetical protein